jgi:monoamine oxidase
MASDQYDVVVLGAGAAGLAAARRVRAGGLSVMVVEARDRIGGRAHTVTPGWPLDLGCGWLHSADVNPFSAIAEKLGFEIDKSPPPWMKQSGLQDVTAEEMARYRADFDALESRLEEAAETGVDRPASELLDPDSPFNGALNAFSAAYNGAEFDQVSVLDYAAYEDSGVNWRLPDGYGALVSAYGAGVPVTLDAAVQTIDHSGALVRVSTSRGEVLGRAVIVCLPTDVIAGGGVRFTPDLPDKVDAAAGLPLGLANKQFLHVDGGDELPVDGHLFRRLNRTETGSYHLRPFGRPLIEAYFGGRLARGLEAEGEGAFAAFAVDEMVGLLGSDWRKRLQPVAGSAWASDPWARGSYSHALPDHAGDRATLARPVADKLFWAGEATSPNAFSTAHGAYQSGIRAGEEVLMVLSPGSIPPSD